MPIQGDQRNKQVIYANNSNEVIKASHRWWKEPDEKLYNSVWRVCDDVLTNLATRRRMNYYFGCLYSGTGASFMASKFTNLYYNRTALDGNVMLNSALTLNAIQSAIDTVASLVAKNKPKPQFLTDEADSYNTKLRGERLTDYTAGVFDECHIYETMQKVFVDACIYGTGIVKLMPKDGRIKAERIFIEEMLIDDLEGMHDEPMQIHQRKYIPRDILLEMFPDFEEEILACSQVSGGTGTFSTADVIPVIESWHLKSGKKAKDGKHSVCIENATLLAEDYTKDYYPFVFFRWADEPLGFWGRGVCHETWKLQRELDILLQTIQNVYRRISGPVLAVENGSNIQEAHLTSNKLVKIIEYTTTKPEYILPPMIQPEMYDQIKYLEEKIFSISGVSQQAAEGKKDPEVKSAVAIRETTDLASGRFELVAQRYETTFLTLADMVVDMSADLPEAKVMVANNSGSGQVLDFKQAKVDRDSYKLQLFPVSGLPSTPAGRLDQLMDYAQMGLITNAQLMDIVDFPDLRDTTSLDTAPLHLVQQILSNIKEQGKRGYIPPSPYMDLQLAYRLVCLEVDRATLQKVDADNVQLLRDWADQCHDLLVASTPQQPAVAPPNLMPQQQMAPGNVQPQPGAAPMPPPTPGQ